MRSSESRLCHRILRLPPGSFSPVCQNYMFCHNCAPLCDIDRGRGEKIVDIAIAMKTVSRSKNLQNRSTAVALWLVYAFGDHARRVYSRLCRGYFYIRKPLWSLLFATIYIIRHGQPDMQPWFTKYIYSTTNSFTCSLVRSIYLRGRHEHFFLRLPKDAYILFGMIPSRPFFLVKTQPWRGVPTTVLLVF